MRTRTGQTGTPSNLRPPFRALSYALVSLVAGIGTTGFVVAAVQKDSSLAAVSFFNWCLAITYWRSIIRTR